MASRGGSGHFLPGSNPSHGGYPWPRLITLLIQFALRAQARVRDHPQNRSRQPPRGQSGQVQTVPTLKTLPITLGRCLRRGGRIWPCALHLIRAVPCRTPSKRRQGGSDEPGSWIQPSLLHRRLRRPDYLHEQSSTNTNPVPYLIETSTHQSGFSLFER